MSKKEKLIKRLKAKPADFSLDELETLLLFLGYTRNNKGKTSGSRIKYTKIGHSDILMHNPHPKKVLKMYQIKQLIEILLREGLI